MNKKENEEEEEELTTISEFPTLRQLSQPVPFKDYTAKIIAVKLLDVFRDSLLGTLAAGFLLIAFVVYRGIPPEAAEQLIDKTAVSFLRGVGTFASTVFGPLLAFILGYYFGKAK